MSKLSYCFYSIKHLRLFRNIIYKIRCNNLYKKECSDKEYLIRLGKIRLGYKMNLDNPQTFNEKLNWYKLNYCTDLMKKVVDKIYAKEYVKSKGLENILISTIKTYDSINDIKLNELPKKFVIKNSMDSGGVFVCKDINKINKNDIVDKLKVVVNFRNGKHVNREYAYTENNNKIIVEELLETPDNHAPWDYKFFCFDGEPKFLFVGSDRDTGVCFDFFDIDFNWLNVKQGHPHSKKDIIKPENYEKMLDICRILSKDFPHVRVDLYNVNGKIYFGELTFYHFAGLTSFKPRKWDKIFGDFWNLNNIKK